MRNVFIAIGGSGTKVAEALVRLLAIGFPLNKKDGRLTSAGGTLEFWVVDPDTDSAACTDLNNCIKTYKSLEGLLGDKWAISVNSDVRLLNPLDLPGVNNQGHTLRSLLSAGGTRSTERFLDIFYESEELDIEINRGFYQKPFIGAAVMAMFAESLTQGTATGGQKDLFNQLKNEQANFFLCGSLHGGTGASGLPVMGKFLRSEKGESKWQLAACLLGPYRLPLGPPFGSEGKAISDELIEEKAKFFDAKNERSRPYRRAYDSLGSVEKKQLVKQILQGFYANPDEICQRAHQGLLYYHNNVLNRRDLGRVFDDVYVISRPQPIQLTEWSNGGKSQVNPADSAEVAAALTSLNFFAGSTATGGTDYIVAASTEEREDRLESMYLHDLPYYSIGDEIIDPERAFLASAILVHFLSNEIPWDVPAKRWSGLDGLRRRYLNREGEKAKRSDAQAYKEATNMISESMRSIVDTSTTMGWHPQILSLLDNLVSKESVEKMEKKGFSDDEPKGTLSLGEASLVVSSFEIGRWNPEGEGNLSRGEYLRLIWSNLYRLPRGKTASFR